VGNPRSEYNAGGSDFSTLSHPTRGQQQFNSPNRFQRGGQQQGKPRNNHGNNNNNNKSFGNNNSNANAGYQQKPRPPNKGFRGGGN
jgi:hypothetical protein